MKVHTTNYFDTLIQVSQDTKVTNGTPPPLKEKRTIAEMQYDLIAKNPYQYTSDDILFQVFTERNEVDPADWEKARTQFFSKGQACFRASPLTKNYGFGIHSNSSGKVALYGMETREYQKFLADTKIKKIKAMKASKK